MVGRCKSCAIYHEGSLHWYLILYNLPSSVLRKDSNDNWKPIKDLLFKIVSDADPHVKRESFAKCNVWKEHNLALCEFFDVDTRQIAYAGMQGRVEYKTKFEAYLCQMEGGVRMVQTDGPIDAMTGEMRLAPGTIMTMKQPSIPCNNCSAGTPSMPFSLPSLYQMQISTVQLRHASLAPGHWNESGQPNQYHFDIWLSGYAAPPYRQQRTSSHSSVSTRSVSSESDGCSSTSMATSTEYTSDRSQSVAASPAQRRRGVCYVSNANRRSNHQQDRPKSKTIQIQNFDLAIGAAELRRYLSETLQLDAVGIKATAKSKYPAIYVDFPSPQDASKALRYLNNGPPFNGKRLSVKFARYGASSISGTQLGRLEAQNPRSSILSAEVMDFVPAAKQMATPEASHLDLARSGPVIVDGAQD